MATKTTAPVDAIDERLAVIEDRLLRVEHAIAQLGENTYAVSVTSGGIRGKHDLAELIREWRAWVQAAQSQGVTR